jgi:type I restriction enzyme S subunit
MNPKRLLQHFNEIAEAPDAVPRLRRFILDLAVRGKLVVQDPTDEPAAVFLKLMEMENRGSTNQNKSATIAMESIRLDEMPFDLPHGWLWVRFGVFHDLVRGVTYSKSDVSEEPTPEHLPILRANNIGASINFEDLVFVRKACIGPDQFLRQGDYMIALSSGSKSLVGKAAYIDQDFEGGFGGFCGVIRLISPLLRPYTGIFLSSRLYRDALSKGSRGIGINNLKKETLRNVLFPLPPLAEQHRIVAKVDKLMALCDELEVAQQKRERRRDRLVAATLNGLNNGDASSETHEHPGFEESARFYFNHLPRLTTRPEHIHQLRQTILNLAVRGQLVPQDPNDEAASELFKRIQEKKARMLREGKIRPQQPLPPLVPDEIPFELPKRWQWLRLGEIGFTQTGTTPSSNNPEYFGDYIPFLKPADLTGNIINYSGDGISKEGIEHSRLIPKHSALMVCIGSSIGKVNITDRDVCCNQQINSVTPYLEQLTTFTSFALKATYFQKLILANAGMGTLPIISKGKWEILPIPLPPLAEQHRIVANVDELLALCDELESRLSSNMVTCHRLLEATLSEAIAPS